MSLFMLVTIERFYWLFVNINNMKGGGRASLFISIFVISIILSLIIHSIKKDTIKKIKNQRSFDFKILGAVAVNVVIYIYFTNWIVMFLVPILIYSLFLL